MMLEDINCSTILFYRPLIQTECHDHQYKQTHLYMFIPKLPVYMALH